MARALAALVWCAALLAAARAEDVLEKGDESADSADAVADGSETPADDDGDSAPFTLVVEHADGRRCSASLVSLRTAITSAGCARPAPAAAPADLWVHAPPAAAPHSSRRVARIAYAAESEAAEEGGAWSDADVAVLELEEPLGGPARAILMATGGTECGPPGACHVVRARPAARAPPHAAARRARLRIVDEALVPADACAALVPRHSAATRGLLCLRGDTLCPSDWGAGVVCEGKLCGVVSRSAWEEEDRRGEGCGALHAAAAVARWRRFLHCAHTPRACSRGGECAHLCTERSLLDEEAPAGDAPPARPEARARPPPPSPAPADPRTDAPYYSDTTTEEERFTMPHRTSDVTVNLDRVTACTRLGMPLGVAAAARRPAPTRTAPRAPPAAPAPPAPPSPPAVPSLRTGAEFEPNRPDFKAGEYGDNAAEYGGEEAPPAPATAARASAAPAPPARSSPASAAPRRELAARVSQEPAAAPRARAPSAALAALALLLLTILL